MSVGGSLPINIWEVLVAAAVYLTEQLRGAPEEYVAEDLPVSPCHSLLLLSPHHSTSLPTHPTSKFPLCRFLPVIRYADCYF